MLLIGCAGSKKSMVSTNDTVLFIPAQIETYVDFYVDEIDGKKTEFLLNDSLEIDAGEHTIEVRMEFQPAAGSSLIVGGVGNLLLRAATNKTFKTQMDINSIANHTYQFIITGIEEGFEIDLKDVTSDKIDLSHQFKLKDGKLERIF